MVNLDKLKALENQGIGSKTSILRYHHTDIITAFTNKRKRIFDILVIDCNTQMIPINGIQKTVNRIWPDINSGSGVLVERGCVAFAKVPIHFKEEYLREGLIANIAVHESGQALTKDKSISHANTMDNFRKSFLAMLIEAKAHNKSIGMPVMGKEATWYNLSFVIEELADSIGYTLPIRVYKRKD